MMFDVSRLKNLQPVKRAVELATGRRPHKSTTYRWMNKGIRGIRLPYVMCGGLRMTNVELVKCWITAVTQATSRCEAESARLQNDNQRIQQLDQDLADGGW